MPPVDANFSSDASPPKGATKVLKDILGDLAVASANCAGTGAGTGADQEAPNTLVGEARLGDIIDRLDERAYGFLILLLALPCCLPFVYLLPQIVALPMLALAGQMAAGRQHPWLPTALHERKFSITAFEKVITRSEKYIGFVERFAKPRLLFMTGHIGARIVGALMLIPAASILVPLPSTNTLPGIGTAITSLGLVERDGVLVILGLLIGLIWVGLLVFLGAEAIHLIKGWLLGA